MASPWIQDQRVRTEFGTIVRTMRHERTSAEKAQTTSVSGQSGRAASAEGSGTEIR